MYRQSKNTDGSQWAGCAASPLPDMAFPTSKSCVWEGRGLQSHGRGWVRGSEISFVLELWVPLHGGAHLSKADSLESAAPQHPGVKEENFTCSSCSVL